MTSETEPINETRMSHKSGEFTAGFLSVNSDRRLVAYASLGNTTVSISRGTDGKVRVEIDDVSDEPVYVSINAETVMVNDALSTPEKPWHSTI